MVASLNRQGSPSEKNSALSVLRTKKIIIMKKGARAWDLKGFLAQPEVVEK